MINEALDYHMNMNHVVFNRERKSVEVMGQQVLDPTKSDIIIEGQIRDRISKIMTAIQKLIQSVSYDEKPSVVTQAGQGKPKKRGGVRSRVEVLQGEDVEDFDTKDGESKASEPSFGTMSTGPPRTARDEASSYARRYPDSGKFIDDDTVVPDDIAPGITTVVAPSSYKRQTTTYNAVSEILTSYNSLSDYIELQNRQKSFTQRDVSNIDSMVKQLIDPLKSALGAASRIFTTDEKVAEEWIDYTRIYNVIRAIISSIETGYPFIKVDPALLSELVPLKTELIRSNLYNPQGANTQIYLRTLANKIAEEQRKIDRLPQQTPTEVEARKMMTTQLNRQKDRLKEAGYIGVGKPKKGLVKQVRSGGHVHKKDVFDDDAELAPYLTKGLKPDKFRKDVPPIESSSEESSGEEGESSDMVIDEMRLGKGKKKGKKTRKQIEDISMIMSMPMKEAAVLVNKKKGGARKKEVMKLNQTPAIKDSGADKDLWFL
jgi:hypothetical protein